MLEEPEDDAEGNDLLDRPCEVDVGDSRYSAAHVPVPILLVVGV